MKRILSISCVAVLTMTSASALADGWKTIRKEADFREMVVGKNLAWNGNTGIINADGTAAGTLKEQGAYKGNWVWSGRFYCRNFIIGGKATGTNCAKVEVSDTGVRFLNNKGKGRVTETVFN